MTAGRSAGTPRVATSIPDVEREITRDQHGQRGTVDEQRRGLAQDDPGRTRARVGADDHEIVQLRRRDQRVPQAWGVEVLGRSFDPGLPRRVDRQFGGVAILLVERWRRARSSRRHTRRRRRRSGRRRRPRRSPGGRRRPTSRVRRRRTGCGGTARTGRACGQCAQLHRKRQRRRPASARCGRARAITPPSWSRRRTATAAATRSRAGRRSPGSAPRAPGGRRRRPRAPSAAARSRASR